MREAATEKAGVNKRARKKAETHQRVLAAAMEIFARRGFDAANTAEIAELAGVSHGTVFAVAPTKESLVVAAYADDIRRVARAIAGSLPKGKSLLVQLERVFHGLYDYYAKNPALSRAIIQHLLFIPDREAKSRHDRLLAEFFEILICLIEAAKRRGAIRSDVKSPDLAGLCFSVYLLFLISLLNDAYPNRKAHREDCRRVLDLALRSSAA